MKENSKLEDIKKFLKKKSKVEVINKVFHDFKRWHDDPVGVSSEHTSSSDSSKDTTSLESHYEGPTNHKIPLVQVRHSPRSQTSPVPRSRSQSPMLQFSPYTPPWSPEVGTGPYGPGSKNGDASMGSLRPSLRSANSSMGLNSRQGSSDPLIVREHPMESDLPPQVAWAPGMQPLGRDMV